MILLQLDKLSINYPSKIRAIDGKLQFKPIININNSEDIFKNSFELVIIEDGFIIKDFNQAEIRAYAYNKEELYYFANARTSATETAFEIELPYLSANNLEYIVAEENAIITPKLELAIKTNNILQGEYDYLMITHPDFRQTLEQLVNYHQNKGVRVIVTDVEDIYAQYSHHRVDANALKTYIKLAQQQMGIKTVLLVGGDSYDYLNNLNIGSISYLPTLYFATDENIRFAPVDPMLTDINDDLIPDLAIGRLPVRTAGELQNIIDKISNFENRQYTKTAIFTADRDTSFDTFSDQMIALLPLDWQSEKAYINQLELNGAKASLINSIETGVTLTSFFGHSGPSSWSFERLFDRNDVLALNNIDRPTLVNQFGCWNTYYVMPQFNTMAHEFMQLNNKGAVAVMGASTLTESFHESELSKFLIPEITQANTTIGQAILQAKQKLASTHPEYLDVILGWTLLGDPLIEIDK